MDVADSAESTWMLCEADEWGIPGFHIKNKPVIL